MNGAGGVPAGGATVIRWLPAIACLLLTACAAPPPITVRIGTLGSIDELPLFVIQERGLERKHGLRLLTSTYVGGIKILEAMAAGDVDGSWNVGTVPLLTAVEGGIVPGRAVAVATNTLADPERPGIGVVVAPSVSAWRDLDGQLVGVYVVNSLGGAALSVRLRREGVQHHKLVEIAMPNLGLALAGGMVAAAAMPEPFVSQSILRGDGKLLDWVIGGPPLPRMVYTVIVVRSSFLRQQRAAVKALLRAHLEAVDWINGNLEPARSLVARRLGITEDLGRRIGLLRWPPDARHDPALFTGMQEVFVQGRMLKAAIAADAVFEPAVLGEVLAERAR